MKAIAKLAAAIGRLFEALGICATIGFIAGALAGMALTLFAMDLVPPPVLGTQDVVQAGLVLGMASAGLLVFYLCVLCRYTFISVFVPVVVNCLLTCILTVWLVNVTGLWGFAVFIGMIVGLLVGRLMCIACRFSAYRADAYGLH
jgi:hypothetical protein